MSSLTQNKTKQVDMLNGPLLSKLIIFAMPLALSSMLQQLFNTADTAVVGRFASTQDMAAVGANSSVIGLIVSLFLGLSIGANVVIAQYIGQGKTNMIHEAVNTVMVLAVFSGIILFVLTLILATPILTLMGTPEDVIDLAVLYLRIYSIGMPFTMLYNFGSAVLRSKGDSIRPMYSLIAAGICNVILNLVLVICFHLGVAGVAIATVVSNVISAGLIIFFLIREEPPFRLTLKGFSVNRSILAKVLLIGVPAGLQGTIFSLSNTVIQSAINSFGSTAIAGSTAAQNLEMICYYMINAFNQAATTFMSQNFGAGKYSRCRTVFYECFFAGIISCGALDLLFMIFHDPILQLFSTDPDVKAFAWIRITHVLIFQCLAATYEISASCMRGIGYSMLPTIMTIFGCVGFRVVWVQFIFPLVGTFNFLLYVYLASWILTGILVTGAYFISSHIAFTKNKATA